MPALIPVLINLLRMMLMAKAGAMVAKVLLFLGLTVTTNKFAIEPLVDQIKSLIATGPSGNLGAAVVGYAGVLRFDEALTMILSAYVAAASIRSAKTALGIAGVQS